MQTSLTGLEVISHLERQFNSKGRPAYAWGDDISILGEACKREVVKSPFGRPMNLSRMFQGASASMDYVGLMDAVAMMGLAFDGFAHGALANARNAALVHSEVLRRLRSFAS